MANMVLMTHWTSGDVYPFIQLGIVLKRRGHQVTLFTHCYYEEVVKQAGLRFVPLDTPQEWARFTNDNSLIANPLKIQSSIEFHRNYQHKQQLLREYEKIKQFCKTDTVLITRHRSSTAALAAAERLQIPLVSVFLAPTYLLQMQIDEELFGTKVVADFNSFREEIGLPPIRSWIAWMLSAKCHIGLWPDWFAAPSSDWPIAAVPVGFPLSGEVTKTDDLPQEAQEMLQDGEPPVLITAGSSRLGRSEFYSASAEACRLLKRRGILVTRYQDMVPHNLPDQVRWFAYLPLARLMPHVGAIIHHGGIGTLSDALAAGIPQLVLAENFDRPDNAARLVRLGVAESLPPIRWRPHPIAEALAKIMAPAFQIRCWDWAQQLRQSNFATTAGELIEQAISNDKFLISSADFQVDSPLSSYTRTPPVSGGLDPQKTKTMDLLERLENISPHKRALLIQLLRRQRARFS